MFGGVYGESLLERKVNDKLMFFPIGEDVQHRWIELQTSGIQPEGRYHHAMYYYPRGNYIVLFGGRKFIN